MASTNHPSPSHFPKAVLFDLLTALLDSWSLWNRAAGSVERGTAWRTAYLRLTYGCGAYVEYEALVREAARLAGLPGSVADTLEAHWLELEPWSGAIDALEQLRPHCKLAVVTNCSERLGRLAASILPVSWDAVVTAERAGAYKPDPRPYEQALSELGVTAANACFVAGSSYDLFGTAASGLRTYWHNRIGLAAAPGAPRADIEAPTLDSLTAWASRFADPKRPLS